jgi:Flp pilus assembly protein TadB
MNKATTKQTFPVKLLSIAGKIGAGLKAYLTDWRNLLAHSLLGVVLLVVAIWAPINPWIKIAVILCLVAFNIWRMRRKKQRELNQS